MYKRHTSYVGKELAHTLTTQPYNPLLGLAEVCQQMLGFKYLTAQPGTPVFDVSPFIHPFNAKFDLAS